MNPTQTEMQYKYGAYHIDRHQLWKIMENYRQPAHYELRSYLMQQDSVGYRMGESPSSLQRSKDCMGVVDASNLWFFWDCIAKQAISREDEGPLSRGLIRIEVNRISTRYW